MMKRIGATVLEMAHLAAMALLVTMSAWVATLPGPVRAWKGSGLTATDADSVRSELERYLLHRGPWIAAIALVAVALASLLRSDAKKLIPGLRIVATGASLLFALWAYAGLPPERMPTAWNCLFVASALNLGCTAFLIAPSKGGASKSAAPKEK